MFNNFSRERITFRKQNQWKKLLTNFMGNSQIKIDKQFNKKRMLLFRGMKN